MPPPGMEGGRSRQKFKCEGCEHISRGSDLSRHYKNLTNFTLLKELRECQGEAALEELKGKADNHTLYMFRWGRWGRRST